MTPDCCPACLSNLTSAVDEVAIAELVAGYGSPGQNVDVARFFSELDGHLGLNACARCGLRWFTPAIPGDGAFYEELQRLDWYYQSEKAEYHFATQHVREGDRVLEVGCGAGAFGRRLVQAASYRGLEFNGRAVERARAAGLDVDMRGIEDESRARPAHYDVVCHFQVLEHVIDPRHFMQTCSDALRPGGTLIVAVPADDSFIGLAESSWLNMPPHHLTRWPDKALIGLFESVGVSVGALWHEPVADIHRTWQRNTVVNAGLLHLLGLRPGLIAQKGKALAMARRLVRRFGASEWLFRRGLAARPYAAQGHSLCLVGQKR